MVRLSRGATSTYRQGYGDRAPTALQWDVMVMSRDELDMRARCAGDEYLLVSPRRAREVGSWAGVRR
ncbi:MAG: hypothetical protein AVDCRST_MAG88-4291 [uncultured Thermomicrobiales bacterium]|uniref:Uncharacterized protein n=1 Tax=uncultured Thermomicrobiales bacterium TaxID=1645740 RepID=A0A6J4VSW5_9BACT|nr:MAG: hypothetical protein AVDCRST_MAG88-4291 [uncultured Thermomicrobiales bacterium]